MSGVLSVDDGSMFNILAICQLKKLNAHMTLMYIELLLQQAPWGTVFSHNAVHGGLDSVGISDISLEEADGAYNSSVYKR